MTSSLLVALTLEQCWHRVPGGTGVAGIGMAKALAARSDLEVIGVAAKHLGPPPEAWHPPIEVKQLPLPRLALYESWHRFRKPKVERATGPVDVIHATSIAMPPVGAPVVVTIHDLAFLDEPSHFTERGLRFFKRGLELALAEAALVVCPSDTTLADCVRHGFEPERLRAIPMGVDISPAKEADIASARRRYGVERPFIMWTGTIEPRKNLTRLLQAFESLAPTHDLVLVGPHGWNEDIETLISKSDGRVRTLGFVPHADLGPLYAAASVFCFPSLLEGFGLPVLEAMGQGTPVVTSKGTSTEELAADAGILVDPKDAESIAEGIARVLEDEALSQKLSEAGRRRAAEYPWERTAELLVAAYREAAR
ncbi:MAG: glycosyltransferase family 4 protein [Actinomycetota bacterium]